MAVAEQLTGHSSDAPASPPPTGVDRTLRAIPSLKKTHRRPDMTAHLLPLEDATPGQQLVAEPVLTYRQAPEGEPRR